MGEGGRDQRMKTVAAFLAFPRPLVQQICHLSRRTNIPLHPSVVWLMRREFVLLSNPFPTISHWPGLPLHW
jgi:hypothetical protein